MRASAALVLAALVLNGCAATQTIEKKFEMNATRKSTGPAVIGGTWCLRGFWRATTYVLYSESYAEAYVTKGRCEEGDPTQITVNFVRVRAWLDFGGTPLENQCGPSPSCSLSDRQYAVPPVTAKTFICMSARAEDDVSYATTSSDIQCPAP